MGQQLVRFGYITKNGQIRNVAQATSGKQH